MPKVTYLSIFFMHVLFWFESIVEFEKWSHGRENVARNI